MFPPIASSKEGSITILSPTFIHHPQRLRYYFSHTIVITPSHHNFTMTLLRAPSLVFLVSVWAASGFPQSPAVRLRSTVPSSAAATVIEIDEGTPRDIGSFDEWANACGVQRADGFQLTVTNEDPLDVGIITSQDLPADCPVIFVPSEMTLSANRAREELGPIPMAEDLFAQLRVLDQLPRFYLFLKLLREYELGDQSSWFPWLNALPRYFCSGASMTQFCCTECLPPLVGNLAMRERTRFKQYFKASEFCDFLSPETRANKRLAKWAYNVCYTRSFQDGFGDYKIAPMADMVCTSRYKM
jgi:hypothetical protein